MTANPSNRRERGSLPLALLAVIIVAGLVVVLVVRIVGTQSQVRFDQGFHASLPVADAGVNLGKFWLNNGNMLKADDPCDGDYKPSDFPVGCSTPPETREIDGHPYTFHLTRVSDREWEVDSTGVDARTGVERRVISTIQEIPLVNVALFADTILNFAGGNAADSYNSGNVPPAEAWCTGHGFIASNGVVDLNGVQGGPCHTHYDLKRTVDQVHLHNDRPSEEGGNPIEGATEEYPGGDRCIHSGGGQDGTNCREVSVENPTYPAPEVFEDPLKYSKDAEKAFIENAYKACDSDESYDVVSWTSSDNDGVLGQGAFDEGDQSGWGGDDQFEFPGDVEDYPVDFHCFDEMIFDMDTLIDASSDEPVIVVVGEGGVTVEGHVHVGCETSDGDVAKCVAGSPGDTDASRPEAERLWIFTNGDITIRQQAAFAGVLWAPNAICSGGAQVHIFGSLICDDASNVGGWRFHYDEALAEVSSGDFFAKSWREEPRANN